MKRALVFFLALVVVAGVIVGVALSKTHTDKLVLPSREVDTFLHAWARNDPADMATLLDAAPPDLADQASSLVDAVPGSTATYTRTGISGTKTDATATYHAQVSLQGLGPIEWDGTMALVHPAAGWRIKWGPNLLFPGLGAGRHVAVNRVWPKRASILAANGSVLAGDQSAVQIGLRPDHIKSPADLVQVKFGMQAQLGVLPADIDKALHQPWVKPDLFVPVKTVPKDAKYQAIRTVLYPIPGIVFQSTSGVAAVDSVLASEIIGSVGEITADRLKELGAPYKVGDQVGLSGMQNVYERRLAGTPRTDVVIADAKGVTVGAIKHFPGQAPQPVQLTIDPATQTAAEAALRGSDEERGPRRDRHDDGRNPRRGLEAVRRLQPRARGHVPARFDVQGHHLGRAARRGQHGVDTGAVPGEHQRRRAFVPELRRRGVRRARPRARVPDLLQQRVHRPRRQASGRHAHQGRDLVRLQRALVARHRSVWRIVPDTE